MTPRKPVLIELDMNSVAADPSTAPQPEDHDPAAPDGHAMQLAMRAASRRWSAWARWGVTALAGFVTLAASVAAWDFVTALLARNPVLGWLATGLLLIIVLAAFGLAMREWMGFRRLRRLDRVRNRAEASLTTRDAGAASRLVAELSTLYRDRPEMRWHIERLAAISPDHPDAEGKLHSAEAILMAPLDAAALQQVEAASRQVTLLTAMIPLALVDVLAALITNLRMIRRVAEVYGGRTGTLGSMRLLRGVIAHLLATGAVAVGEDMLGSVASGGVVSKLSRRFGEGVINGALTARLGIAAIEVCRPLPFAALPRPRTSAIMSRAASGLFESTRRNP